MSMRAIRWARRLRGISSTQKIVLLLLADTANEADEVWWSAGAVAADACMSERTVRFAFDDLEALGLIRGERSLGRATKWTLCVTEPAGHYVNGDAEPRNHTPGYPGTTFRGAGRGTPESDSPPPEPDSDPPRNLLPTETKFKPKESEESPLPPRKRGVGGPEVENHFEKFFTLYPNKAAKPAARTAFLRAVRRGVDPLELIDGVEGGLQFGCLDTREFGRYCVPAHRWIRQGRQLDWLERSRQLAAESLRAAGRGQRH